MHLTMLYNEHLPKKELTKRLLHLIRNGRGQNLKDEMHSLLELKADPNIGNKMTTPLITATTLNFGNPSQLLLKMLLKHNADVNLPTSQHGRTALHAVTRFSIFEILIEHDADINFQNHSGRTPLMTQIEAFRYCNRQDSIRIAFELFVLGTDLTLSRTNGISVFNLFQTMDEKSLQKFQDYARTRLKCVETIQNLTREMDFSEMLIGELLPFYTNLTKVKLLINFKKIPKNSRKRKKRQRKLETSGYFTFQPHSHHRLKFHP